MRGNPARLLIVVLFLIGYAFTPVSAVQVVDLYQAETLVFSQSPAERRQAATDGLAEVILRVSGIPDALQHPQVVGALKRAETYVYEFYYNSTDETLADENQQPVPAEKIILKFSAQAIDKLLRQAQLPIWPANRHSLTVWMVEDSVRNGLHLVSETDSPLGVSALKHSGVRRGLPLINPLLDLQDQMALPAKAAWQFNEAVIREASARYGADGILVGRYSQTSRGQWRATWLLLREQGSEIFDSEGFELDGVIARGLDKVANYLAGIYSIVPRGELTDSVIMKIEGVGQFGDYAQLVDYIEGLAVVRRVHILSVDQQSVMLQLFTEGDFALLTSALNLDKKLQPVASIGVGPLNSQWGGPKGSYNNPLNYRWPQ